MAMGEDCDELGIALPNPTGSGPFKNERSVRRVPMHYRVGSTLRTKDSSSLHSCLSTGQRFMARMMRIGRPFNKPLKVG
jgi:hypothetical protein